MKTDIERTIYSHITDKSTSNLNMDGTKSDKLQLKSVSSIYTVLLKNITDTSVYLSLSVTCKCFVDLANYSFVC